MLEKSVPKRASHMDAIIPNIPIVYQRSFRLLFFGNLCQRAGFAIILGYTSLFLYRLGASLLEISLFSTLPQVVVVLSAIPWGRYSDRSGNHRVPIIVGSLSLVILVGMYFLLNAPWQFILVTCLVYVAYAPYIPIANAYSTVLSDDRGRALGILLASSGVGWFTGSTLAGFVFAITSNFFNLWFMALILLILATIQFVFLINRQKQEAPILLEINSTESVQKDILPSNTSDSRHLGYGGLIRKPVLLLLMFAAVSQSAGVSIFSVFYGPYFIDGLGGNELLYGMSQALPTLIGTFLVLYFGSRIDRQRNLTPVVLLYSFIAQTVMFSGILFTRNPFLVALFWSIPAYPGIFVGAPAIVSDNTSISNRSKGMTLFSSGSSTGRILGPLIATIVVVFTTLSVGTELPLLEVMPLILTIGIIIALIGFICALLIVKRKES